MKSFRNKLTHLPDAKILQKNGKMPLLTAICGGGTGFWLMLTAGRQFFSKYF